MSPWLADLLGTLGVVTMAELGDKSQLVCLALAARFGPRPVIVGAMVAFALLNGVAVLVGATLAAMVPALWVRMAAAVLFVGFGLSAWRAPAEEEDEVEVLEDGRTPWMVTMGMLLLAELGDKTQLAVAGLAAAGTPWAVWIGGTLALTATSAVAALVGGALLASLPRRTLALGSGLLFVATGLWLGWSALA